jgi:hypothetical protein
MHEITNKSRDKKYKHNQEVQACLQNAGSEPSSITFGQISGGVSTKVEPEELPRSLELSGVTPALLL